MSKAKKQNTPIAEIRRALADYIASEGCSCCRDSDRHEEAAKRLGKLLRVKKYPDTGSYNFYAYQTKNRDTINK